LYTVYARRLSTSSVLLPSALLLSYSCTHRHLHSFPTRRSSDLSSWVTVIFNLLQTCSKCWRTFISSSENAKRVTPLLEEDIKVRSEEHTSELQSRFDLVCRLLLEKKK